MKGVKAKFAEVVRNDDVKAIGLTVRMDTKVKDGKANKVVRSDPKRGRSYSCLQTRAKHVQRTRSIDVANQGQSSSASYKQTVTTQHLNTDWDTEQQVFLMRTLCTTVVRPLGGQRIYICILKGTKIEVEARCSFVEGARVVQLWMRCSNVELNKEPP
nr:hypothetical protein [Tanacetum cinerariifolium]